MALFESTVVDSRACHRALHTVELLEKILLKLPIKDLLFAQSVSTTWKSTIERSPTLQKALFFRPAGSILACYESLSDKRFSIWTGWDRPGKYPLDPTPFINPLMAKALGLQAMATMIVSCEDLTGWQMSPDPAGFSYDVKEISVGAMRPEASWRRMVLCQPVWAVYHDAPEKKKRFWFGHNLMAFFPFRRAMKALAELRSVEMAEAVANL